VGRLPHGVVPTAKSAGGTLGLFDFVSKIAICGSCLKIATARDLPKAVHHFF
jgi:hypothetical protein